MPRRLSRPGLDQSRDSPTLEWGYGLRVQADDAQARFSQQHTGRQSGDASADDRDVIARSVGHSSERIRSRAVPQARAQR